MVVCLTNQSFRIYLFESIRSCPAALYRFGAAVSDTDRAEPGAPSPPMPLRRRSTFCSPLRLSLQMPPTPPRQQQLHDSAMTPSGAWIGPGQAAVQQGTISWLCVGLQSEGAGTSQVIVYHPYLFLFKHFYAFQASFFSGFSTSSATVLSVL